MTQFQKQRVKTVQKTSVLTCWSLPG